ncbi:hypothetical protein BDK51DRAFT_38047 [Blyttiomyces helicus]|uniref:Uncharacterized protein n=1 Tax=Blyttiomyces helicus TaxID=388810 RepID=A0A4P9WJR3_9FUNG|nr:hypothetical protein BDK51DRAFT_38047 [Blyttiomyces helicus]|eukprot:RKO93189.1 hypothetical protein BDK51DRAFT_38047 [Blyttiomyces helicus]
MVTPPIDEGDLVALHPHSFRPTRSNMSTAFNPMEIDCSDFSFFKSQPQFPPLTRLLTPPLRVLTSLPTSTSHPGFIPPQEARALDDNIVPRLNTLTTRSPDLKEVGGGGSGWGAEKRKTLASDPENADLNRSIQVDEAQRRQIQSEWTVEEIVRDRTREVFRARCRGTSLPKDFWAARRNADSAPASL